MTDASGNIVGDQRYYPFGETRLATGSMYTDKLFTSQREMAGLGIYHYGARFYSPKLGRFLSADSIVPNPANPQDQEILVKHLEDFFFGDGAALPPGYVPPRSKA